MGNTSSSSSSTSTTKPTTTTTTTTAANTIPTALPKYIDPSIDSRIDLQKVAQNYDVYRCWQPDLKLGAVCAIAQKFSDPSGVYQTLQKQVDSSQKQVVYLQDQLNTSQSTLTQANIQISRDTEQITTLQSQILQYQQQLTTGQGSLNQTQKDLLTAQTQIQADAVQIANLQKDNFAKQQQVDNMTSAIVDLQKNLQDTTQQLATIQDQLITVQRQVQLQQQKIDQDAKQIQDQQQQIKQLQLLVQQKQKQIDEDQKTIQANMQKIQGLELTVEEKSNFRDLYSKCRIANDRKKELQKNTAEFNGVLQKYPQKAQYYRRYLKKTNYIIFFCLSVFILKRILQMFLFKYSTPHKDKYLKFKEKNPILEQRQLESLRVLEQYPDRLPIICEKIYGDQTLQLDKHKYLCPKDLNIFQFLYILRKRLKMSDQEALFLLSDNHVVFKGSQNIQQIYEQHKDQDGFLYIYYTAENTFG